MSIEPIEAPWKPADDSAALVDFTEVLARYPALARFRENLGGTSLREVPNPGGGGRILAKCEWENPFGSVKDRVAFALLCDALREDPGPGPRRVLEYSGGNLAGALSRLAEEIGIRLRVVLSDASAQSLLDTLAAHHCEVELVDRRLGFIAVIDRARRTAAEDPGWRLLYQHRNPVNVAFHETTTGSELVAQLAGVTPAAWVASIGTGGTFIGVLRALRREYPDVRAVGVSPRELEYGSTEPPNGRPKYAGSGGLGNGVRQPFVRAYDAEVSGLLSVSFDEAIAGMGRFRDLSGLRIGSSAAANWIAACEVARGLAADQAVVTVFPDAGSPEEWRKVDLR
jgi:cysteine synthase